jgi:hypothetical protein
MKMLITQGMSDIWIALLPIVGANFETRYRSSTHFSKFKYEDYSVPKDEQFSLLITVAAGR